MLQTSRDDFDFEIVNFPFHDEDVPLSPFLWCIYFATYSFCESVFNCDDFNNRNLFLTT